MGPLAFIAPPGQVREIINVGLVTEGGSAVTIRGLDVKY